MTSFTLHIEMLSDWRIGSGTGRPGDIDNLIRRDRDGLPFLPGKTITGVWRDGCEQAAAALDNGADKGPWWNWVNYLFGSQPNQDQQPEVAPIPAHCSIKSAHFPDEFKNAIAHKPLLLDALTFTKPGIKINAESGSAEDQCFRLEEMARGGILLKTSCALNDELTEAQQQTAKALLAAGAALVERIGNKRRRGAGRCKLELENYNLHKAHTQLTSYVESSTALPQPPSATALGKDEAITSAKLLQAQATSWHTLQINITAQQPLVISKATVGNVVETLDYIPGRYLLPIIARQLNRAGLDRNAVSRAIADNQIVITPAYRCERGQRGLPTPFALFKEKVDQNGITYNRLHSTPETAQLKQYRGGYVTTAQTTAGETAEQSWRLKKIHTGIETHNTVEDALQRPDSSVGGVYSYQAIPAGTVLQAELRLSPQLWETVKSHDWQSISQANHSLGRSRKDEYGSVTLTFQPIEPTTAPQAKPAHLTVWCLSDILLRDDWLRPTTSPTALAAALSKALDLQKTLQLTDFVKLDAEERNLFARHNRIDSWQTSWGLARPSLVGIQAGSCFVFELPAEEESPSLEKLAAVEQAGLGERRVEGFGQVKLNPELLQVQQPEFEKPQKSAKSKNPRTVSVSLSKPLNKYATLIEKEAWRSAIRRVSLAIAADPKERSKLLGFKFDLEEQKSKPSLTQLGGLRSQLMPLHQQSIEENSARSWLKALKQADKWQGTVDQVLPYVSTAETIWETLDLLNQLGLQADETSLEDWLTLGKGRENERKTELWAEAVETFLSACIRAHKRDAEANQDQTQTES